MFCPKEWCKSLNFRYFDLWMTHKFYWEPKKQSKINESRNEDNVLAEVISMIAFNVT